MNSIGFETSERLEYAKALSEQFNLILDNMQLPRLSVTADKLVLISDEFSPLFVDFNNDAIQKRREEGKKQGLIRACKPVAGMKIIDATAGWGRDAAILASFGAEVLMLERTPMMAALLADGLARLTPDNALNLVLVHADTKHYLAHLSEVEYPDVIYIDPMHPVRQKSALVKKDMQILQHLIGADEDVVELIAIAVRRVKQRVVVKWPQRVAALVQPNFSIEGKTVRFDIYTPS